MSRWANVGSTALIISWLVWHTANIPMARVELSGLRSMKWKYVSGRSASSVCVSLWVCEQGRGIWSLPNSPWQNSASLGHFLQTAIRPNQSSCSVLEYSNCTNQLHLAAPQLVKTWAALSPSEHTHTHTLEHDWLRPPFKSPVRNNNTYFIRPAGALPATFNSLTRVEMSTAWKRRDCWRFLQIICLFLAPSGAKTSKMR